MNKQDAVKVQNELLVKVQSNLQKLLQSKVSALPKGFNETRFIQNVMVVLQDTQDIETMTPVSIARTMLKGAFLGLDFFNKECYAIPYNKNVGTKQKPVWIKELQFQTDYKGETKLAKKYSIKLIADIYAKLVREGDEFEESIIDGNPNINFKPKAFNPGKVIGVFAVCRYADNTLLYDTMTAEEVDKIRTTYSKQPDGKMWKNSWGEGAKKTCLRRLCKMIELDFENIEQQEAHNKGNELNLEDEIPYLEPIPMPVAKTLKPEEKPELVFEPTPDDNVSGDENAQPPN